MRTSKPPRQQSSKQSTQLAKQRREQIAMVVLSVIDLLAGLLSIIFSQVIVQVIATVASGATLVKAVKIAKAAKLAKTEKTIVQAATKVIPAVTLAAVKAIQNRGVKDKMKLFLQKLTTAIKNNPITVGTALFEAGAVGGGGYGLYKLLLGYCGNIAYPWNLVITISTTIACYAIIGTLTVFLGYDNRAFKAIRTFVKLLGEEAAVDALDRVAIEAAKAAEEAEAKAKEEADKKAREDEIWQKIIAEEQKRENDLRERKIAAYLAQHPEEGGKTAQ